MEADLLWSLVGLVMGWTGGFSLGYYVGRKKYRT